MQANPHWGALGFLIKKPEVERTIHNASADDADDSDKQRRIDRAKTFGSGAVGYEAAASLRVWLSKSKPGGVIAVEDMDSAYIANSMRMIKDGRHPTMKPSSYAALLWMNLFDDELRERKRKEEGEVPF